MTVEVDLGRTSVPGAFLARDDRWISGEIVAPSAGHQVMDAGGASCEQVTTDDVELVDRPGGRLDGRGDDDGRDRAGVGAGVPPGRDG